MSSDTLEYVENSEYLLGIVLIEDFGFYDIDDIQQINSEKIKALNYPNFIIDLNKVSFIDSSAISLLIDIKKTLKHNESEFLIVCDNPDILRIASMTNMDRFIKIFDSLDLAVDYLAA